MYILAIPECSLCVLADNDEQRLPSNIQLPAYRRSCAAEMRDMVLYIKWRLELVQTLSYNHAYYRSHMVLWVMHGLSRDPET